MTNQHKLDEHVEDCFQDTVHHVLKHDCVSELNPNEMRLTWKQLKMLLKLHLIAKLPAKNSACGPCKNYVSIFKNHEPCSHQTTVPSPCAKSAIMSVVFTARLRLLLYICKIKEKIVTRPTLADPKPDWMLSR